MTENLLHPQTEAEEYSVPLRRLIKEIKEGLVKDGLTDVPTGMIKTTYIITIFLFLSGIVYLMTRSNVDSNNINEILRIERRN